MDRVRRTPHTHRPGLTLAEVAISTLLVGLVMVTSLRSVEMSLRTWETTAQTSDGHGLARQLLGEIEGQAYEDVTAPGTFGLESGETSSPVSRLLFDDLDDFNGWTASPPQDAGGAAIPGYAGWTRRALVQKIDASTYSVLSDTAADTGLRKITVSVTDPSGHTTVVETYRTRPAGTLQPSGVDQTVVNWVGLQMKVGENGEAVSSGTLLTNHAEDHSP